MGNKPIEISTSEWKEIMKLSKVREAWGLKDETPEEFSKMAYGVKFNFVSSNPSYIGDLFIIHGDHLIGDPPLVLIRNNGYR